MADAPSPVALSEDENASDDEPMHLPSTLLNILRSAGWSDGRASPDERERLGRSAASGGPDELALHPDLEGGDAGRHIGMRCRR